MKKAILWILVGVGVVTLGVAGYMFYAHAGKSNKPEPAKVSDFYSCEKSAGSTVLETSPEVCVSVSGARFSESPSTLISSSYPLNQTKYIAGFDKAPDSLKKALLTTYFRPAEETCLANDVTNREAPDDMYYITVERVTGNDAIVHFCPSTADVHLTQSNGSWWKVTAP